MTPDSNIVQNANSDHNQVIRNADYPDLGH